MAEQYTISITARVFDERALMAAAAKHVRESGGEADYEPQDAGEALRMVLDSGPEGLSPCDMGFEIMDSSTHYDGEYA